MPQQKFDVLRTIMVQTQLKARGIRDDSVIKSMLKVPRHLFVPEGLCAYAYEDSPLDIGYGQTISQPYIVAFMSEAAHINKSSIVLDIGTGSGYQAAVLAEICKQVYTIEIVEPLGRQAGTLLGSLYKNVHAKIGDGYEGWPEHAPFDAVLVAAAAEKIPHKLIEGLNYAKVQNLPFGV